MGTHLVHGGEVLQTGELIGPGNNSGFSFGNHLHDRQRRVIKQGALYVQIDKNNANNTFDPTPYFNGKYAADVAPAFHYQFNKDLTYGMENEPDVWALQKCLQLEGIFPVSQPFTKYFGNVTFDALKTFQRKRGIAYFGTPLTTGYGRCGRKTREVLNRLYA